MSNAGKRVDIAANVARIRERIARAAERSGRTPGDIKLVAVSKVVEPERVKEAIAAGVTDVGENYVQEAAAKRPQVGSGARWHMIGHLQRNKAAQAAQIFDMIQTVDSERLAEAIGRRAQLAGLTMPILLQVNTSDEESKFGAAPDDLEPLLDCVREVPGIRVEGLMTIGRWDPDPERARPEFRLLAGLARRLQERCGLEAEWLSMGMSHDFEIAIEEGANLIRVGTGVFGPRPR
ncbi:MAG TPA: YggS family pyridoxal phosphate-dependent enzyme [Armatimonadota bacterium]|nr:YggS family pyridoxal phosphate-dependent enzyme [Armatimonadota bacterium]